MGALVDIGANGGIWLSRARAAVDGIDTAARLDVAAGATTHLPAALASAAAVAHELVAAPDLYLLDGVRDRMVGALGWIDRKAPFGAAANDVAEQALSLRTSLALADAASGVALVGGAVPPAAGAAYGEALAQVSNRMTEHVDGVLASVAEAPTRSRVSPAAAEMFAAARGSAWDIRAAQSLDRAVGRNVRVYDTGRMLEALGKVPDVTPGFHPFATRSVSAAVTDVRNVIAEGRRPTADRTAAIEDLVHLQPASARVRLAAGDESHVPRLLDELTVAGAEFNASIEDLSQALGRTNGGGGGDWTLAHEQLLQLARDGQVKAAKLQTMLDAPGRGPLPELPEAQLHEAMTTIRGLDLAMERDASNAIEVYDQLRRAKSAITRLTSASSVALNRGADPLAQLRIGVTNAMLAATDSAPEAATRRAASYEIARLARLKLGSSTSTGYLRAAAPYDRLFAGLQKVPTTVTPATVADEPLLDGAAVTSQIADRIRNGLAARDVMDLSARTAAGRTQVDLAWLLSANGGRPALSDLAPFRDDALAVLMRASDDPAALTPRARMDAAAMAAAWRDLPTEADPAAMRTWLESAQERLAQITDPRAQSGAIGAVDPEVAAISRDIAALAAPSSARLVVSPLDAAAATLAQLHELPRADDRNVLALEAARALVSHAQSLDLSANVRTVLDQVNMTADKLDRTLRGPRSMSRPHMREVDAIETLVDLARSLEALPRVAPDDITGLVTSARTALDSAPALQGASVQVAVTKSIAATVIERVGAWRVANPAPALDALGLPAPAAGSDTRTAAALGQAGALLDQAGAEWSIGNVVAHAASNLNHSGISGTELTKYAAARLDAGVQALRRADTLVAGTTGSDVDITTQAAARRMREQAVDLRGSLLGRAPRFGQVAGTASVISDSHLTLDLATTRAYVNESRAILIERSELEARLAAEPAVIPVAPQRQATTNIAETAEHAASDQSDVLGF